MRRQAGTLLNLGISIALIAGIIWFLVHHRNSFGFGNAHWIMSHHMTIGGGGMGIIMTFFWIAVIAAIAIVVSSIATGRRSEGKSKTTKNHSMPWRYLRTVTTGVKSTMHHIRP